MAARATPKAATSRSAGRGWPRSALQGRRQTQSTTAPVSTRIQATPAAGMDAKARTASDAPAYCETALTAKRAMR